MLSTEQAQQRAHALVERAIAAGADAADASYGGNTSETVEVRLGALEEVERSEGEHVSLRAFCGARSASIGSSDLSDAALDELAQRVVDMARAAPEDKFAGLADAALLTSAPFPQLDLEDAAESSPESLREMALEAEDAARAVPGITNSEGGGATTGQSVAALATSHGFDAAFARSSRSISAVVVAGEGASMQRDHAWRQSCHGGDLPTPAEIGKLAGERTVARVNPDRVTSGSMPVVFSPRVGGSLIGHLAGAISGNAIARRASFLLERLNDQLFDSAITIEDDPLRLRGLRSRPFDGEGLATRPRKLVDGGKLTGWLMDSASARQLELAPTGHASRGGGGSPGVSVHNVCLLPGAVSPAELMQDIKRGVFVTELIGHGVNGVTGDYSRGASGFLIENGELAGPIAEFTVAGNLVDMFAALTPADDLEIHRGIDVPTIRVDAMSVAGD